MNTFIEKEICNDIIYHISSSNLFSSINGILELKLPQNRFHSLFEGDISIHDICKYVYEKTKLFILETIQYDSEYIICKFDFFISCLIEELKIANTYDNIVMNLVNCLYECKVEYDIFTFF